MRYNSRPKNSIAWVFEQMLAIIFNNVVVVDIEVMGMQGEELDVQLVVKQERRE
ncbi:MAG: hypothetical protein WC449_05245 [Candidatus Paceibacterota bacterium]